LKTEYEIDGYEYIYEENKIKDEDDEEDGAAKNSR
jgi:hypothetical protein